MLLFTHPSSLDHDTGAGHPERRGRLDALLPAVRALPGLEERLARAATRDEIAAVHPGDYAARLLAAVPESGRRQLDADTVISPGSGTAALHAAGAACAAVDAVLGGEAMRAFCATRPPGHHAEPARAMGFCLFNNVAIGARHARAAHGIGRVAIVDFDVHHGNGTQAAFWDDPDVLYVSTHQWPLYPGTGRPEEKGAHGNVLNGTLPPGAGSVEFRRLVERQVLPAVDGWRPELVMISAGFDAHARDPLASLELVEADFAWVTAELVRLAMLHAKGRVVSTLEGGYDTGALAASAVAHVRALAA